MLKTLNHPNFVSLKAVCIDKNQISLLLQYFNGINSGVLIDDEELQKEYYFRENKKKIIKQILNNY